MSEAPEHIQEFNTVAGLILAHLYRNHPIPVRVPEDAIAAEMGLGSSEETLPTGRAFDTLFSHTFNWLGRQGYIDDRSITLAKFGCLAEKGFRAMNGPSEGGFSLGENLIRAPENEEKGPYVARVIGNLFGSFAKSSGLLEP